MHLFRTSAPWALLLLAPCLAADDIVTRGTISVGAGGALQDGDRPSFQQIFQHRKTGYGGIEDFQLTSERKDTVFTFNARAMPGDDNYRLLARFEKTDKAYFEAGYTQYRVWYDGSGGYFRPTGTEFTVFDEDLSVKRSTLWAEVGLHTANHTMVKLRYERLGREGTKSSTFWGDTNLTGTFGGRGIVPTFYALDEVTNVFTFDIGNSALENAAWHVGARYAETTLDNRRHTRRRPQETADRIVTTHDDTKTDLFATHGYYQRQWGEKLSVSAGALITNVDSTIEGSRIYGQTFDPVYDPAYVRRQQRDEGYYDLEGTAELKQTVLNLNAAYAPSKHWSIRPSLRFENLHQESIAEFMETNIGPSPAFVAILEDGEGEHEKKWDEFSEAVEIRHTGLPNLTFSARGEWLQGSGNLEETRLLEHGAIVSIDRDTDTERTSQKYSFTSNWYAQPGLTLAAQYYYKVNQNDYEARRDNTPAGTSNRYPAYLANQDFETHDFNMRMFWRATPTLNLVTRYDVQQSKIHTGGEGLLMADSSKLTSHIVSQAATFSPTARVYLNANVNVTFDQMNTPAIAFVQHGDNNYVNGSLGCGFAAAKKDDFLVDASWFRASNFIDRSEFTQPYGVSMKQQALYLTWVRRESDRLIYTMRYGYITARDGTWVGRNDFNAHVVYGKVQYHF
ncbi:MAG: hypothetical protein Q7S40_26425 [Opitutaceae bacterium]|nr:hypothetical protein [Opitutaceae bacterium]